MLTKLITRSFTYVSGPLGRGNPWLLSIVSTRGEYILTNKHYIFILWSHLNILPLFQFFLDSKTVISWDFSAELGNPVP